MNSTQNPYIKHRTMYNSLRKIHSSINYFLIVISSFSFYEKLILRCQMVTGIGSLYRLILGCWNGIIPCVKEKYLWQVVMEILLWVFFFFWKWDSLVCCIRHEVRLKAKKFPWRWNETSLLFKERTRAKTVVPASFFILFHTTPPSGC